jgi:hypothetical protein
MTIAVVAGIFVTAAVMLIVQAVKRVSWRICFFL